ncbi:MAG: hypothetical protein H7343_07860 [Undibacterium sp.]|nr:hypothetical protein [Opitutaceae bacterium]
MTAVKFLDLKQRSSELSEKQRQNLSAHLIQLSQVRASRKQETSRRLNAMASGEKVSVSDLNKQLGHS